MFAPDTHLRVATQRRYKVLLAHNHYQSDSPSGEDEIFRVERDLLRAAGHSVVCFEKCNDDLKNAPFATLRAAANCTWSQATFDELCALIERERPDVAHFHNTFPLISPSAYAACRSHGVPVVQTLHNYRLICPGALLQRDGRPCEDCVGQSPWPAVRHGCYRDSVFASAAVARMLMTHRRRRTYQESVDVYIALTEFAKSRFVRGGLPASRVVVRPNGLANPPEVGAGAGHYALYVGRLSAEKGVRTLLEGWRELPDLPLRIVGDGPLRDELERLAVPGVTLCGRHSRAEVYRLMQDATLLVVPSEWYEGFPMTVLEGLACGVPLVVSAIGALDAIIGDPDHGRKFAPGDAADLRRAVRALVNDPVELKRMRVANRALFDVQYSAELARKSLQEIYARAISVRAAAV
jgi:glycosyltransferase involved in cell wall biosynthesis